MDKVKVVVKPNNRYGDAQPGTTIWVTQHELDTHPHCLRKWEEAESLPQIGRVHLPVALARKYNFPVGEYEEGSVGYEVARIAGTYVPRAELNKALDQVRQQETLLQGLQQEIARFKGKKA